MSEWSLEMFGNVAASAERADLFAYSAHALSNMDRMP
jgi:hypothetical protein